MTGLQTAESATVSPTDQGPLGVALEHGEAGTPPYTTQAVISATTVSS